MRKMNPFSRADIFINRNALKSEYTIISTLIHTHRTLHLRLTCKYTKLHTFNLHIFVCMSPDRRKRQWQIHKIGSTLHTANKLNFNNGRKMFERSSLTLLTSISFSSKCRPYILGDSPGIGSILRHTSWPLRALSTCLWLHSIDVTTPISKNWNIQTNYYFIEWNNSTFHMDVL